MEEFRIQKGSFKEVKNTILLRRLALNLFLAIIIFAVLFFNKDNDPAFIQLPILLAIVITVQLVLALRQLKKYEAVFESFSITVNDNEIISDQWGRDPLIVSKANITEIIKYDNGVIVINSNNPKSVIIPKQIQNADDLEKLLLEIKSIRYVKRSSYYKILRTAFTLITISSLVLFFFTENKLIAGITGGISICYFLYYYYMTKKSKVKDERLQRASVWIIVFICLITLMLFSKLMSK